MQIMWVLMIIMFAWNAVMAIQHRKLKDKVHCTGDYQSEDCCNR
jgi:hypothetical protein